MKRKNIFLGLASQLFSSRKKQNLPQQLQQPATVPPFPSLNLDFDLVRERLNNQSNRVNTLDTKASFVLSSSTLLIGVAVVTKSQIPTCHSLIVNVPHLLSIIPLVLRFIPLILAIVYIFGIISAYQAYKIRGMYNVPDPRTLYEEYLTKTEYETKRDNFRAMLHAYEQNNKSIDKKVLWTNLSLVSLVILAILLAIPLFFQVLC